MSSDPSFDEHTSAVLSPREEWLLFCWMAKHPRVVLEDTTTRPVPCTGPHLSRLSPLAYALGLAVGTLWLLVRRWW